MHAGEGSDGDRLAAEFALWSSRSRAIEAAAQRSRQRWLGQQAAESTTLAGLLLDMTEQHAQVTLRTASHTYSGRLSALGRDFCILEDQSGFATIVRLGALVTVQSSGSGRGRAAPFAESERRPALSMGLVDALGMLAADRQTAKLTTGSKDPVTGELMALGEDVITLGLGGGVAGGARPGAPSTTRRQLALVPVAAIEAVALL